MVAFQCLVAIWAATSKRHWFWRALAVWAAVMLMVPIRAWEPAWLFGLSSPLIIGLLLIGRWLDHRWTAEPASCKSKTTGRWRFSLRDLLLFVLIAAIWLPGILEVVRHYQPKNWLGWLASSVSLAVLAATSYACARGPRCWRDVGFLSAALIEVSIAVWVEYPVFGIVAAIAGLTAYAIAFDRRHWLAMLLLIGAVPACAAAICSAGKWMRWHPGMAPPMNIPEACIVECALVLALVLVILLARAASSRAVPLYWRAAAGATLSVVLIVGSLRVGPIYWRVLATTPPDVTPAQFKTPVNHYDRIFEIARLVAALDPKAVTYVPSPTGDSTEVLRATQAPKPLQDLYDELLVLLDAPSAVPYDPQTDANAANEQSRAGKIQTWRALARSLQAEANLALTNHQPERVADFAIANMRFADMLGRGGLEVDAYTGVAFRRMSYIQLIKVWDELPADRLHLVLAALQRSMAEREDQAVMWARQAHFEEQIYGWHIRLDNALAGDFTPTTQGAPVMMQAQVDSTANIVLQTAIAIRLFEREQGFPPPTLESLVPAYLPAIPCDPPSQPLRYHTDDQRYVLYSIGWDGLDDGGQFGTYGDYWNSSPHLKWNPPRWSRPPTVDFDLETLTRP